MVDKAPNIGGEMCPECGDGPYDRLKQHITMKHGDNEGSGTSTTPRVKSAKSVRKGSLQAELKDFIDSIGAGVSLVNMVDGAIILNGSDQLAAALNAAAMRNPALRDWLDKGMNGSVYGGLMLAVMGIVYPILTNHGIVPAMPMFPTPNTGANDGGD